MKKMRIVGRIIAGAVASALLLSGALSTSAQAAPKDGSTVTAKRDTGWGGV